MKIKKQIIFSLNLIIVGVLLIFIGRVYAERSWDNKTENENVGWEQEIENWNQITEAWSENRDSLHEQYFDEKYKDDGKYCDENTGECWEEDMFDLIYTKNGQVMSFDKDGSDAEVTFSDKSRWECSNGGQVLIFNSINGEHWESSNTGQVIEYKNAKGDRWESSNTGQTIIFEGADGEKWESSNNGQVVEHTDKNGKTWSGSDDDTVDDMR